MSTKYFHRGSSHKIASEAVENRTRHLTMDTTSPSGGLTYSYLPTPDGSVEGLGIVCDPAEAPIGNESAIDVAYETAVWEEQIDNQIRQFQQAFEQKHYLMSLIEAPLVTIDVPRPRSPGRFTKITQPENNIGQQTFDTSRVSTDNTMASFGTPSQAQQHHGSPPGFEISAEHSTEPACEQLYCDNQQIQPPCPMEYFSYHGNTLPSQSTQHNLSSTFNTPHLQPSAAIHEEFPRRLSVSCNTPSSVFSGDCQDTPYFRTPCTTPYVASSTSTEFHFTPISELSSPVFPSRPRSPSSSSLKAPATTYRSIRPAPYTTDTAQRQRWSTGKTMSLPSRYTQLLELPFSPGRMRAVSEHSITKTYFDNDFANGDRASFNQNLEIIRQYPPTIVPSIEQSDEPQSLIKTEAPPDPSEGPALPSIHPRLIAPLSVLSQPHVPPLDLPEQPSRPVSPTLDDLLPSDDAAVAQNPVSPLDMYRPKYKRGMKGKLEGFCGLCQPGRWLNMKNSAYWYDKNYKHGINSKTRRPFELPVDRRWKMGSSIIREGLCGVCNEWTRMDSCKMSWTNWWKHAYKCHNETLSVEGDEEHYEDVQESGADQLEDGISPTGALAQHTQHTDYVRPPWPYPSSQTFHDPAVASQHE